MVVINNVGDEGGEVVMVEGLIWVFVVWSDGHLVCVEIVKYGSRKFFIFCGGRCCGGTHDGRMRVSLSVKIVTHVVMCVVPLHLMWLRGWVMAFHFDKCAWII